MADKEEKQIKLTKKVAETTESLANEMLSLMGSKASATAQLDKKNDTVSVVISAEDESGLLIGKRGETLLAIQTALGMMLRQELGGWVRIMVDVGGWREKQDETLRGLAIQAAEKARETGEPQPLYNLNPGQRRVVHMALSEESDVETESLGEDEERYLVVKVKS